METNAFKKLAADRLKEIERLRRENRDMHILLAAIVGTMGSGEYRALRVGLAAIERATGDEVMTVYRDDANGWMVYTLAREEA